jgi:hypothetical protein
MGFFLLHIFLEMKGKNQTHQKLFINVRNNQKQFKNNCKIIIHKLVEGLYSSNIFLSHGTHCDGIV